VSRLIDRLVTKGFVRRERATDDRRMLECFITGKGLALLEKLDAPMDQADDQLGTMLTPHGVDTLNRLLAQARGDERR
jgi:DNA-binding MarR family transcriptional regulator